MTSDEMTVPEAIGVLIDRAERWDTIMHEGDPCELQIDEGFDADGEYPECPETTELWAAVEVVRKMLFT